MIKEFLSRPITKKYYDNYDAIFGKKKKLTFPLSATERLPNPPVVIKRKIVFNPYPLN